MPDLWAIVIAVGVILGIPASLVTLYTVFPAAERRWHLRERFKNWRNQRNTRFQLEQAKKQFAEQIEEVKKQFTEQIEGVKEQVAEHRAETAQVIHDLLLLHSRTGQDLNDAITSRELLSRLGHLSYLQGASDEQIKALQSLVDDLILLEAQYRRGTTDRSPQAKRIIEAAKGRDVPPLPKLSGQ